MSKPHGHSHEEEKHFSANLEELRKVEDEQARSLEKAVQGKEKGILKAREEAQKIVEEARSEALKEREKLIEKQRKEVDKGIAKIMEKAQEEAKLVRKGKDVGKAAEKLLPIVLK